MAAEPHRPGPYVGSVHVTQKDMAAVVELSYQLGAVADPAERRTAMLSALGSLIGADVAFVVDVNLAAGDVDLHYEPNPPWKDESLAVLRRTVTEHPLINHYLLSGDGGRTPLRISDLVPGRQWADTRIYAELFSLMGARHQLAIPTSTDPRDASGVAFNRAGRDFDVRTMTIAAVAQPMLIALRQAGSLPRPAGSATETASSWGLTARETEVLELLSSGMTAAAIGRALRISPRTVRKHLEHVYAKLGHGDRLQAVTKARSLGILPSA